LVNGQVWRERCNGLDKVKEWLAVGNRNIIYSFSGYPWFVAWQSRRSLGSGGRRFRGCFMPKVIILI
jgi:hypothetical protein